MQPGKSGFREDVLAGEMTFVNLTHFTVYTVRGAVVDWKRAAQWKPVMLDLSFMDRQAS